MAASFDDCASQLTAALDALRLSAARRGAADEAWANYRTRLSALRAVVDEVVVYSPATADEAHLRRDVAGRMMSLCHATDETWLEFEAEKILPLDLILDPD